VWSTGEPNIIIPLSFNLPLFVVLGTSSLYFQYDIEKPHTHTSHLSSVGDHAVSEFFAGSRDGL
jgi:hypothetical protein